MAKFTKYYTKDSVTMTYFITEVNSTDNPWSRTWWIH